MNKYIFLQILLFTYQNNKKKYIKKTECTIFPNQQISNKIRIKPDKSNIKSI